MTEEQLTLSSAHGVAVADRENPYVGPRPFRASERHLFFGREREAESVVNSLVSSRVMLLHSPSGAGKTSLIQTSVVPAFEKRNFLISARFDPAFRALRVNLPPPVHFRVANRYVFSVVNALVGDFTDHDDAAQMTLLDALDRYAERVGASDRPQLVVLDQLEEVLTLERGDLEGQEGFFRQLGDALDDPHRWALLAIRDDYVGALDRFRRHVPGQLRSTYRLDLLDRRAARRAAQKPAGTMNVTFDDAAADLLVDQLRLVHSGQADEEHPTVKHPYVESVLLQVVCYSLWRKLRKDRRARGEPFERITVDDVEDFRPFDKSLSKYYRSVVNDVTGGNRDLEHLLRHWAEHELIGKHRLRRQTRAKPPLPNADKALAVMGMRYLVRDDPRPGGSEMWELSHDMLVGPIMQDNHAWRVKHLDAWQVRAEDWRAGGEDPAFLLTAHSYRALPSERRRRNLTETEDAFLQASERAFRADGRLRRMATAFGFIVVLLAVSVVTNVALLWLLLQST